MDYIIQKFEKLDSTNSYAKMYYLAYENKTVIWAINQTNGYGRFKRSWESNKDLTFSVIFKNNSLNHSILAPLAVVNVIRRFGIDAQIKWPNDIVVRKNKICGILIETIYEGNKRICDIVGIGINLKSREGRITVNDYVMIKDKELLDNVLLEYNKLMRMDFSLIIAKYRENSVIFNYQVEYRSNMYSVDSINDDGHLVLKSSKERLIVTSDEITLSSYYSK